MSPVVEVLRILAGAALTFLTCLALGRLILIPVQRELTGMERTALGFVLGSACLSLLVFFLGVVGMARPIYFGCLAAMALGMAVVFRRRFAEPAYGAGISLSLTGRLVLLAGCVVFGGLYFTYALAPEVSPDGTAYHLGLVARYLREHRIGPVPTNFYAGLSQGLEMLFLFAFSLGRHPAAALVHLLYLPVLGALMLAFGHRQGRAELGLAAGILVAVTPVVGIDAASAYNDVALACVGFACFYLVTLWESSRSSWFLFLAGCAAGFCYGVKYSGVGAIALGPVLILLAKNWRLDRSSWVGLGLFVVGVLTTAMVWPLRNAVWYGNPLAPLYNSVFPNDFVHISLERSYRADMADWGHLASNWQIPLEVTARGLSLQGFLGPVFLLLFPMALVSLRCETGRRLLLAALAFGFPFTQNRGTRFLIPALPFVALAAVWALRNRRLVFAVILAHMLLSVPPVASLYCDPQAWRIREWPWRAALRIDEDEEYQRRTVPEWDAISFLNSKTPREARILALSGFAEAYVQREVVVADITAIGERLRNIITSAHSPERQPNALTTISFSPAATKTIRVFYDGPIAVAGWAIHEIRVFGPDGEVRRRPDWLLSADPNASGVGDAFDNNPVTSWETWREARKGMYVEVDMGRTEIVSEIRMLTSAAHAQDRIRIELQRPTTVRRNTTAPATSNAFLRRAAAAALRAARFDYIFLKSADPIASDLREHVAFWEAEEVYNDSLWSIYRMVKRWGESVTARSGDSIEHGK